MQAEIIAIGSELTTGCTINSNAATISNALSSIGIPTLYQTAVPDDPATIKTAIEAALARGSLTITTGGLGPTLDDITRPIIAQITNSPLRLNTTVVAHLEARYGKNLATLQDQATIPESARPLLNFAGEAPGLFFEEEKLIVLPGVPLEMETLLTTQVIPLLKTLYPTHIRPFVFPLYFHSLKESDVDPILRSLEKQFPKLTFGIYPHLGLLTIRVTAFAKDEQEATQLSKDAITTLSSAFSSLQFTSETGKIEEAIHRILTERKLTLATAESCTGGRIAAAITALPGASAYFLGSIVTYSNALKESLLGVKTVASFGAVSPETAQAMLEGLFKATHCDCGVAVTGIAGPTGATPEKPIGTVYVAVGLKGQKPVIVNLSLRGTREAILEKATNLTLANLLCLFHVP